MEASMDITEVRVFPVNEERLKAYATITFDDCFIIRDLKIIDGNNGLFVAMPSKKRKDETRERIEDVVLREYEKELSRIVEGGRPVAMDEH
jgi:stage V sporulation protein G